MTNFNWYFTREEIDNNSPSREDGVPLATEVRYRREGARLIINASNTLGLYPTPSLSFSLHLSLSLSLSVVISLTVDQSLRDYSDRGGVLPEVLHVAEFQAVQSLGGGSCLPPAGREGRGDA